MEAMKKVREIEEFRKMPVNKKRESLEYRKHFTDRKALTALKEIVNGIKFQPYYFVFLKITSENRA